MNAFARIALVAALALASGGAAAQAPSAVHVPPPGVDPLMFKPLPERKDIVSWKLLAQVELVKVKDRYLPQFSSGVAALNRREVKLQGFMMPLEMGDKQTHFILSSMPQSCMFCMPGGPESLVEVRSKKPVVYGFEPIVISGRLEVLQDDPSGVYYRLSDAQQAK